MNFFDVRIWENRYVDLWVVPHFLKGVILAFIATIFRLKFWLGFWVTFGIAALWEIFEHLAGVREYFTNRVADILFSLLAFIIFYKLFSNTKWSSRARDIIFAAVVAIWIAANIIGWIAYQHYAPFLEI